MESYPKYQYSQFDKVEGQYVVRSEDQEEFKKLVALVKIATGNTFPKASQTQNPAPTGDKPKVPYMWSGDTCPTCNKGILAKTVKVSKTGEKYDALICDQQGCKGFAYVSKYPKPDQEPTIQLNDSDLPF